MLTSWSRALIEARLAGRANINAVHSNGSSYNTMRNWHACGGTVCSTAGVCSRVAFALYRLRLRGTH